MMLKKTITLALLTLAAAVMLASAAAAAPREEHYQIQVPVDGQGDAERERAIRTGLAKVLVRISGREDISQQPKVAGLLAEAGRFVQRFRYDNTPDGLQLSVLFEGGTLHRALGELEVPIWQSDKPPVLVWLAVDGGGERMLVGAHERPALREPIMQAARDLGLNLLFPLLDLEDMAKVRFSDVWGGFAETIRAGSERYGTPVVVMARVHREGNDWVGRWTLLDPRIGGVWQTRGSALQDALAMGPQQLANRLHPVYARVPNTQASTDELIVEVQGVRALRDYVQVEQYLGGLGGVRGVRLARAEGEFATFNIALEGSAERVLRSLRNGGRLREISDPTAHDEILRFAWRR